jgi:hypothetical protein
MGDSALKGSTEPPPAVLDYARVRRPRWKRDAYLLGLCFAGVFLVLFLSVGVSLLQLSKRAMMAAVALAALAAAFLVLWLYDRGKSVAGTQPHWCCDSFEDAVNNAGRPGCAITIQRLARDAPAFLLEYRTAADDAKPDATSGATSHPIPIASLRFCPWCGACLSRWDRSAPR